MADRGAGQRLPALGIKKACFFLYGWKYYGMRMWENSDGRDSLPPWGNTQASRFTMGDRIFSGASRGKVADVDTSGTYALISVVWDDGNGGEIVYPMDADYLRKALPWE